MNPLQMLLQVQHELGQSVWPGGSGDEVFGTRGSFVMAGTPNREQIAQASYPWNAVTLAGMNPDQNEPGLLEQQFRVFVAALVHGDRFGEFPIIGGSITDFGKSENRGVEELTERVRNKLGKLTGADGAHIIIQTAGPGATFNLAPGRHVAIAELGFAAWCTSDLFYAPPQKIAYNSGDSLWSWEGSHCSSRYDFLAYRLVEKAGSSPSTSPSDGTTIYTNTSPSYTESRSVSGNTYTVFAQYNGRTQVFGTSAVEDSSEPRLGSYISL